MAEGGGPRPDGSSGAAAPEVRHLVERLREARESTGLSFAALAARTAYSKSSWERYLNGRTLPPRDAVEALAKLSGADPARLLALWLLADRAWSGRDARGAGGAPDTRGAGTPAGGAADTSGTALEEAGPRRPDGLIEPVLRRRAAVLAAAAAALAGTLGVGAWAAWTYGVGHRSEATAPRTGPCSGEACTNRDPEQQDTDCWTDAGTRAQREVAGRTVELRVSPACRAAWGRIVRPRDGDRIGVVTADGRRQSRQIAVPGRYQYTLMTGIDRASEARVCFELVDGPSGCSPWGR
ncbi:transcriptional regulator with XRE-family HTH domain [Streptomyces achromogenes]|uniref:helix-turn-helix domain-containing protein n=1 Tax=Streptomyces achromogenes TaxID=67255 RepID=UPI002783DABE|nr:XRE family transcriptional regulator [Streptomyces achromogenes]MDQ0828713.1 transcriptional regulator with XRE-family HTH domain [Streptomyces achromogenes]